MARLFTCQVCGAEKHWQLVGLHQGTSNAVCAACVAAGHTLTPKRVAGLICPTCGVHFGTLEHHVCTAHDGKAAKRAVVRLLLRRQQYRCLGCRLHFRGHYRIDDPRSDAFVIDHDHRTGRIRGLLCYECNYALGVARDSPERIMTIEHPSLKNDDVRARLRRYLEQEDTGVPYDPTPPRDARSG